MYAVILTGGKQYKVSEGDVITVEKLKAEVNEKVDFDKVLLIGGDGDVKAGTPYLDAAIVSGTVIDSGKGKKVIIYKYKSKKDYRKKQGHRQPFTTVQIEEISLSGKTLAKLTTKKEPVAKTAEEPAAEVKEEAVAVEIAAEPVAEKKAAPKRTKKAEAPAEAPDKPEAEKEKKPAPKRAKKAETEDKAEAAEKPEAVKEKKPAARKPKAKPETETDKEDK